VFYAGEITEVKSEYIMETGGLFANIDQGVSFAVNELIAGHRDIFIASLSEFTENTALPIEIIESANDITISNTFLKKSYMDFLLNSLEETLLCR
jgi:hypothetical protein